MMIRWSSALIALVALFVAPLAHAERIRLDNDSPYGAVVIELEGPAIAGQNYQIHFNPASGQRRSDPGDNFCLLDAPESGSQFYACKLTPGRYVSWNVSGSYTFLCYTRPFQFEVRAGEAIFVGRVRANDIPDRTATQRYGQASSRPRQSVITIVPVDGSIPLSAPDQLVDWEDRAALYLREAHPRWSVPLRAQAVGYAPVGRCQNPTRDDPRMFVPGN
jgi:hypothetical protein